MSTRWTFLAFRFRLSLRQVSRDGIRDGVTTRFEVGGKVAIFFLFVDQVSNLRASIRARCGRVRIGARSRAVYRNGLLVRLIGFGLASQLIFVVPCYPSVPNVCGRNSSRFPRRPYTMFGTNVRLSISQLIRRIVVTKREAKPRVACEPSTRAINTTKRMTLLG